MFCLFCELPIEVFPSFPSLFLRLPGASCARRRGALATRLCAASKTPLSSSVHRCLKSRRLSHRRRLRETCLIRLWTWWMQRALVLFTNSSPLLTTALPQSEQARGLQQIQRLLAWAVCAVCTLRGLATLDISALSLTAWMVACEIL